MLNFIKKKIDKKKYKKINILTSVYVLIDKMTKNW